MKKRSCDQLLFLFLNWQEEKSLLLRFHDCQPKYQTLLIAVEGTQTPHKMHAHFLRAMINSEKRIQRPAGDSGRAETPQRVSVRRLSAAPRKAKCLERKSTAHIQEAKLKGATLSSFLLLHINSLSSHAPFPTVSQKMAAL